MNEAGKRTGKTIKWEQLRETGIGPILLENASFHGLIGDAVEAGFHWLVRRLGSAVREESLMKSQLSGLCSNNGETETQEATLLVQTSLNTMASQMPTGVCKIRPTSW
jgi:hypothetical protein